MTRTTLMPFQPGDRVVDVTIETQYGRVFVGTVKKLYRNQVHVHWDVDHKDWFDSMYVDELRFATEEDQLGGLHLFLRKKTITICELPEEDVVELDKEIREARENGN